MMENKVKDKSHHKMIINIKYFEQQQLEVFNTKNTLTFVVINLKKKRCILLTGSIFI